MEFKTKEYPKGDEIVINEIMVNYSQESELSEEDIQQIANTYHNWRNPDGNYEDVKGFCCSAPIARVKELDYVLTPGRYVGLPDDEDDFDFKKRFTALKAEFEAQLLEETELNREIIENLARVVL